MIRTIITTPIIIIMMMIVKPMRIALSRSIGPVSDQISPLSLMVKPKPFLILILILTVALRLRWLNFKML